MICPVQINLLMTALVTVI